MDSRIGCQILLNVINQSVLLKPENHNLTETMLNGGFAVLHNRYCHQQVPVSVGNDKAFRSMSQRSSLDPDLGKSESACAMLISK